MTYEERIEEEKFKFCENNNTKLLENVFGVENLSFNEDICDNRCVYWGKHIKRGGEYRKENKIPYTFPKYISCVFTKNGGRMGIKFETEQFIIEEDYKYEKMDTVDIGDGLIKIERSFFGKSKPILLPYLFIGNKYKLDTNRIVEFLREKISLAN